ncbi:PHP domain-containing protein (plasmid) [Nocardiopsis sp. MT53]|uniref:DNA polymerase III subunit alpha n=1 Tax=Nocardiopsis changdeensis TaxID=2831969 RepID=A0A975KSG8_9ACTN|nr:DNA polymerase III subunit alpha [Nocardiopsis changdeensis]QYX40643.1 PHP domain-containing protein [Nocardiopsis sp. MT53]
MHLRVASFYSLRHGTAAPRTLVDAAAFAGYTTAALTDRDTLIGAAEHVAACRQVGLGPVLGADLALAVPGGGRATVLARGRTGWGSLCRLVSAAHHGPAPAAITPAMVAERPDGLVVLLGLDSDVGRALAHRNPAAARAALDAWQAGGADTVLGVHDHGVPGQRESARALLRLGEDRRLLVVAAGPVRYPAPDGAPLAAALDRIRSHAPGIPELEPETGRAHPAAEEAVFGEAVGICSGDTARARRLLAHTRALAASCVLGPAADLGMGQAHLPEHREARAQLRARVADGAARLGLERSPAARERAAYELSVIDRMGYWSYFTAVDDAARAIREKGIRCAARGSAVGSLVVHLLGISPVDPLQHGLLFERFLTPSRGELPDIDLDVESHRRLEAYDAVLASHPGPAGAVAMVDTYRARSALRDAGAALSLPAAEVDLIASAIPRVRADRIRETIAELPELRAVRAITGPRTEALYDLAEQLAGLPRHLAMHPCGLVLGGPDLPDRVASQPSPAGYPLLQADKHHVEEWGLLKLDVLGVRMQSAISHALAQIEATTGTAPDLDTVPEDDPATLHLMATSATIGAFQVESGGQRELLSRLRPQGMQDLIADISLFRPGPVGVDMVGAYLDGRAGSPRPTPHTDLDPVLADTGGAVLYHEQLLRVLDVYLGCGLDAAEAMRRTLATPHGLTQVREQFHAAAAARGRPADATAKVWEIVDGFRSYGFCAAHAAAFATPALQSVWLKAHHPAAFFAGLLTHHPGMYPRRTLIAEARRMGVRILPLDLHTSAATWQVEKVGDLARGIRPPLSDIGSLTDADRDRLLAGRPYTDLRDLITRTRLPSEALDDLIMVGALDALCAAETPDGPGRRDVLLHAHALVRARPRTAAAAGGGGDQLALDAAPAPIPTGRTLPLTHTERLAEEARVLGYEISGHHLDPHVDRLTELAASPTGLVVAADLHHHPDGSRVTVAGRRIGYQTPPTRSGRRVVFFTVEDRTGVTECAMFADTAAHAAATLAAETLVVVRGRVRRAAPGALPTLTVTGVRPLLG